MDFPPAKCKNAIIDYCPWWNTLYTPPHAVALNQPCITQRHSSTGPRGSCFRPSYSSSVITRSGVSDNYNQPFAQHHLLHYQARAQAMRY
ncbi:hypothetical protein Y032_0004g2070 [Ancylostoma ceylanicum]|uniref:Uncharacterized protein n=1 Tax=Ancylostoma ceylanicum TaxID=53326 RepID=A0A016VV37_9BILA|nr:hypothetical protein Y032_0004g2070 [Ancylostoma ceylanicum]